MARSASQRHHRRSGIEGVGVFTGSDARAGYAYIHYKDDVKMEGPTSSPLIQETIRKAKREGAPIGISHWTGEKYERHEVARSEGQHRRHSRKMGWR